MGQYRLYYMRTRDGHIERVEDFEAQDDRQAARFAEDHLAEQPIELWSGPRKICRYPYGGGFAGDGFWPPDIRLSA